MNTFYRVDEYYKGVGSLLGFYSSLLEYDSELIPTAQTNDQTHLQITEFKSPESLPSLKAWESGEVTHEYYFEVKS